MNLPMNAKEIITEVKFLIDTNMLAWFTIKKILKKTWTWLKHNWKVPLVLVYTIVLWLLFRRKDDAREVLEVRAESYKAQIEAINKAHKDEIEKRNKIIEEYNSTLDKITEKYAEDKKELDSKKKKEVKELVEKYYNNPDELAKRVAERFGLEYEG